MSGIIKVRDRSIVFKTIKGVLFEIETRYRHGIAIYKNGRKILSLNVYGRKER